MLSPARFWLRRRRPPRSGPSCASPAGLPPRWPVAAQAIRRDQNQKARDQPAAAAPAAKLPFGNIPKGPMQIFISINQQKLHLYSNGENIAETLVATGVPQHPTPVGAFSIVQKQLLHHSNIYSGAPMPFMERITWSGVALARGREFGPPGLARLHSHVARFRGALVCGEQTRRRGVHYAMPSWRRRNSPTNTCSCTKTPRRRSRSWPQPPSLCLQRLHRTPRSPPTLALL